MSTPNNQILVHIYYNIEFIMSGYNLKFSTFACICCKIEILFIIIDVLHPKIDFNF